MISRLCFEIYIQLYIIVLMFFCLDTIPAKARWSSLRL